MAIETKQFTVGEDRYEITQLGALAARRVFARVGQILSEPLKALANADALSDSVALSAIAGLLEKADPDFIEEISDAFMPTTRVYTDPQTAPKLDRTVFDSHFAGRPMALYLWLGVCLQHNFADFLGGKQLTDLRGALVGFASRSQKVSTGSAGGS